MSHLPVHVDAAQPGHTGRREEADALSFDIRARTGRNLSELKPPNELRSLGGSPLPVHNEPVTATVRL